jgi:hypothetical protein
LATKGDLTNQDYQAIIDALAQPLKSQYRKTVVGYRNRLAHGIRPSVDYPQLFTEVESRAGTTHFDAKGKEVGKSYAIRGGKSGPEFLFGDLYTALSDYMGHVADMLKALKCTPRLS